MKERIVAQQQSILGRVGGTIGGIAIAQSQGWGMAATAGAAFGGYVAGSLVDGYLNSNKDLVVVKVK